MRRCTPLNQAVAKLKLSDQSDPDLQRYLRHTYTDRQRFLAFIERYLITFLVGTTESTQNVTWEEIITVSSFMPSAVSKKNIPACAFKTSTGLRYCPQTNISLHFTFIAAHIFELSSYSAPSHSFDDRTFSLLCRVLVVHIQPQRHTGVIAGIGETLGWRKLSWGWCHSESSATQSPDRHWFPKKSHLKVH